MSSALQPATIAGSNLTDLEKANLHLQLLRQEYLKLQEKLAETQKKINLLAANADAEGKASFPSRLVAIVRNLFDRPKYSDVTIKIGGGVELRGHKFVLAARSEIWSSLLDEDDEDAGSSSKCPDVVDLSRLPHKVGYAVMRWVYCDEINFGSNQESSQDDSFVLGVMAAAGSLHLKQLMTRCEERLIACVNVRNCICIFTAAHEIGAERLKNHCSELISSHWSDFTQEDFKDMNAQLLHGMLKQRTSHPLHSAILLHRDDVVFLTLIENDSPSKVDQPDASGNVPLMLALSTRQEGLAKTLVEHKANVNARDERGYSLLHQAIMNGDAACAKFLLGNGADPLATTLKEGSTALHLIAGIVPPKRASGDGGANQLPSVVVKLLEIGADPNSADNVGRTPLHVAIDNGNYQVVEEMLKGRFGVNLEKRNHDGNSPLWLAIRANSGEVDESSDGGRTVRKLVELGASVNAIHPSSKDSILHLCARASFTPACLYLLDCGASVNVANLKGESVLHVAARLGMCTLIQRTLRVGGNPNLQTFEADEDEHVTQETPLHVAVRCRQTEAIAALLQHGMASAIGLDLELRDSNGRTVLGSALKRGDLKTAKTLVQFGAKVNVRGPVPGGGSKTLLEQALEARDEAAILFLIDEGVQLDDGELSKSPLLMAVEQNLCKVVEALCKNGASLGNYSEPEQSPLWIALDKQFWDVASVLVRNGFDVEGWNAGPEGCYQTLLHKAIDENKEEAAAFLIRSGCNVDALRKVGPDGRGGEEARDKATPLHLACQWGQELVAETLLEFGADVNVQDIDGQTSLHVAIMNRHDGLVSLLLTHPKLDLGVHDKLGRTPLHSAMVNRNNKAATGIVERNPAAVNLHDSKGKTFLHSAVIRGDLEGVLFLLSLHVDIDTRTKDSDGCTALHLAVKSCGNLATSTPEAKESIIRHLLLAGADPNAQTLRRLTPLHLAACEGSADIAQILLSSGASPSAVDDEHNTPLHTAMKNSRFSVVKVLLMDERTDMMAVNLRGFNCLHILCKFGTDNAAAILEWMLEKLPDFPINKQDAEGNTGLLLAYMRGHAALCKALGKAGACLGVPNKLGVTIFNYQLATKTLLHRLLDCVTKEPPWAEADLCLECGTKFSLTTRKHHCRHCGRVLCSKCSSEETPIVKFGSNKPARVCDICYKVISLGIGATSLN